MEAKFLSNDIKKNIELITDFIPVNYNFITRNLILKGNVKCALLYMSNISKKESIENGIITPLLFHFDNEINVTTPITQYISQRYIAISETQISNEINKISDALKKGNTIILIESEDNSIICNTSKSNFKKEVDNKIDETIRGEKSSFVDLLDTNIGMIQEKLKNKNLKIENYTFGEQNNSEAALLYMKDIIDPKILEKLKSKLQSIQTDYIPDTGYLAQFIDKNKLSVFPQSKTTEKPDKVISDLLQGKAVILINGCAYALILPVVFIEFFQGFEDYSNRIVLANFDRMLRLLSIIVQITITPIYLVLLMYNAELIPIDLIKIIIVSRRDNPLPPFLEILVMQIIVEFLREGGLRLPSIVGQTLSIVGGIILGEAAIQAGIVSPTTLVVVSVTVIASFLIPNYEMSLAIRILQFLLLIMAQIFGFYGVIIGLFFLVAHLMNLESLSVPYFAPFAPIKGKELKDSALRSSLNDINSAHSIFSKDKKKEK